VDRNPHVEGIGIALLIVGSFDWQAPDWDVPASIRRSLPTQRRLGAWGPCLSGAGAPGPRCSSMVWLDGCYAAYWAVVSSVALNLMREANAPASLSLF